MGLCIWKCGNKGQLKKEAYDDTPGTGNHEKVKQQKLEADLKPAEKPDFGGGQLESAAKGIALTRERNAALTMQMMGPE